MVYQNIDQILSDRLTLLHLMRHVTGSTKRIIVHTLCSEPGGKISINNISTRFNNLGNPLMLKYIFKVTYNSYLFSFNRI